MKVLFVASGNKKVGTVSSFVRSQYDSLVQLGIDIHMMPTQGKGLKAYLRTAKQLRHYIRTEKPDIIHAHYSLCGWAAVLACLLLRHRPRIVVSILGSFPEQNTKWRIVRFCVKHLWDKTIVKSQRTADQLGLPVTIIPNGVNLDIFHLIDRDAAREQVGFESDKKYIIWCSNPERKEKNWPLAESAVAELRNKYQKNNASLVAVYNRTPQEVVMYMNAADCLLLTSDSEGSPNVIKEAMACNCPIVTTDVGDVKERLEKVEGCYVVPSRELTILAEALKNALAYEGRTNGRERILTDQLTIEQVAQRILNIYMHISCG